VGWVDLGEYDLTGDRRTELRCTAKLAICVDCGDPNLVGGWVSGDLDLVEREEDLDLIG